VVACKSVRTPWICRREMQVTDVSWNIIILFGLVSFLSCTVVFNSLNCLHNYPARPTSQLQLHRPPPTLLDDAKDATRPGATSVRGIYRDLDGRRQSIESGLNMVGKDGAEVDKINMGPEAPQPW
jgi:hypothetical protein